MAKKGKPWAEMNWAEKTLFIVLWPFKILLKILFKLFKFIVRTTIAAPITLLIWVAVIVLLIIFFI